MRTSHKPVQDIIEKIKNLTEAEVCGFRHLARPLQVITNGRKSILTWQTAANEERVCRVLIDEYLDNEFDGNVTLEEWEEAEPDSYLRELVGAADLEELRQDAGCAQGVPRRIKNDPDAALKKSRKLIK